VSPAPGEKADFVRRAFFDSDDMVGARWWNDSFQAFHAAAAGVDRRKAMKTASWVLGLGLAGAAGLKLIKNFAATDEPDLTFDAIDLQRRQGWNAGHPDKRIELGDLVRDVRDKADWLGHMRDLVSLLAPDPRLARFGVPTLFQALADPANQSLVQMMRPYHPPEADAVFARGEALRKLYQQPDAPRDLALMCDLPGPLAVAFAAALAPRFCPVFTFDNWPHPLGVVPSHLTLGACLYYLPLLREGAQVRPQPAPALFVLDANRLNRYRDQPDQFDNRYVAPLPSAASLRELGVKRVLYVRPDADSLTELDDLNADFVSWDHEGIAVRAMPLSDFSAVETAGQQMVAGPHTTYYWGGHSYHHALFWRSYGFGAGPSPSRRAPRTAPPPAQLSSATSYRPIFRPTLFSTRTVGGIAGVGRQKPSGFGRISVRAGGGRSGSFGRARSSSWG
jgi:hypothetical protein